MIHSILEGNRLSLFFLWFFFFFFNVILLGRVGKHALDTPFVLAARSVIGAIIIVTGFYGVMWAQSKEEEKIQANTDGRSQLLSHSRETPLLEDNAQI